MYYAIIGDIVASKKLSPERRREAQFAMQRALEEINSIFEPDIAADFLITLGDEFQGLMLPSADPIRAALKIMHEMRPFEIRIAIALGGMTTSIRRDAAIGADGPAFHMARAMEESMKPRHGARLRAALNDKQQEDTINAIAALCDRLCAGWTEKQERIAYEMLEAKLSGSRLTQTQLAQSLGIGQSTVNAQLAAAGFNEYMGGIMQMRRLLKCAQEEL